MQSTQYCTELSLYNDPETNDSNIHTYSHVVTNGNLLCFQIAVFGLRYFASPLLLPNQHFPMHTGNIPWSNVLVYTNDANWKLLGYSFFFIVHQVMPMPYQIVLWLSYHKNECDARQCCQYTVHMKIFTESEEPPADQSLEHQEAGTMLFRLCKG